MIFDQKHIETHQSKLFDRKDELLQIFIATMIFFWVFTVTLKYLIEKFYRNQLSQHPSLKLYFEQSPEKRWLYISYMTSSVYSACLVYAFFKSLYSCE